MFGSGLVVKFSEKLFNNKLCQVSEIQELPKIINSFIHLFHHDVLNFYIQSEKNHLCRGHSLITKKKRKKFGASFLCTETATTSSSSNTFLAV